MTTNLFTALRRLLPEAPVILARVVAHDEATDTSVLELPSADPSVLLDPNVAVGSRFTARGRTVAVGQRAFVRAGVVESQAPDGEVEEIIVGCAEVYAPLAYIGPGPAPSLTTGAPYSLDVTPLWTGGVPPYRYTLAAGTLPAGLALDTLTGLLSGTPTTAGTTTGLVLRLTDASAAFADSGPFSVTVAAPTVWRASQPAPDFPVYSPPALQAAVATAVSGFETSTSGLTAHGFESGFVGFTYGAGAVSVSAGAPTVVDGNVLGDNDLGRYNMTPGLPCASNPGIPSESLDCDVPNSGSWLEASASFTLSLTVSMRAFSCYLMDLGDFDGSLLVKFFNGATLLHEETFANVAGGNGNLVFFGLLASEAFDQIQFVITQVGETTDVIGFDQMTLGSAA